MELIKDKRIGKVLLIVEGGRYEFNLVKKVFVDILDFTQIEKRRGNTSFFKRNPDKHSVVAVVNTRTSNIASITEEEYLETVFEELIEQQNFDVNNAAIYYLFDRDSESNRNATLIKKLVDTLKNSRENDNHLRGGLLILSYPSVEAYEVSNFIDNSYELQLKLGSEVKKYINDNADKISMNKISDMSIIHAGMELRKCMERLGIDVDLENLSKANRIVFDEQERCLEKNNAMYLISMLSCMLMDLGILRE